MKLGTLARQIRALLVGDGELEVSGVASIQSATARDLVFVDDEKHYERALKSGGGAVVVGEFAGAASEKPLLIARQPRLAFARAAALLLRQETPPAGIHRSAVVDATAKVDDGVAIGAHAAISCDVSIGSGTIVGAGVFIGAGVRIGRGCVIHANVSIYPGTRLADRVIVHAGAVLGSDGFGYVRDEQTGKYEKFPQLGTLDIGDDVEIGANSTLDRGALDATVIKRGTKIDNLVHVGHNVQIGEDIVIAAQTGISGSSVLEDGVVVAGQVGIADHVRIEKGAILGAQSGIPTGKVLRGSGILFWGTPARPIRQYLKELAVLARLAKGK